MKTNKFYIFIFIGLLLLSSCDKGFEEMNKDPNNPTAVPAELMIPGIVTTIGNEMYRVQVGGDMGACWAQQISKVQYNDEERFYPRNSLIDIVWDRFYANIIADANQMYKLAVAEENNDLMGIALVLKAYGFSIVTDLYGMAPYTEALLAEEGNTTPVYDSQETIYMGITATLDEAYNLLGTGNGVGATSDLIYQGDMQKWKSFAHSLKFRTLMRISGKKDVSADLQALYSAGNLFSSNADEAKFAYQSASPNANPIWETIVDRTRNEYKACSTLVDLMVGKGDERVNVFFGENEDGDLRAKPPGIADVPSDDWNYANVSPVGDFYLQPENPAILLSNAELQFLIAEAAQRGLVPAADATAHFESGVVASFEANGIASQATAYLAANTLINEQTIAEEKYVALYWQGLEVWTETRRTGYPELVDVADKNPSVIGANRYFYHGDEASVNGENYNAAVSIQGADALDTKLWWMP